MISKVLMIIADHYGLTNQTMKLVEECNELAIEAMKIREGHLPFNLVSEIADVEIMIAQIKYLCGIDDADIEKEKEFKIHRQLERMGAEKK